MTTASVSDLRFEFAWRTDQGRIRARNEDAVAVAPELALIAIADGMGGANAGNVASQLAVDTVLAFFRRLPPEDLTQGPDGLRQLASHAIGNANRAILNRAATRFECSGMGTTIVFGMVADGHLVHAYVGDSRIYCLRSGELRQLSHDHSLIQTAVDQGLFASRDEARRHGISEHILVRVLGSDADLEVPTASLSLVPGDLLLFCTDGLTGRVPDADLLPLLTEGAAGPLDALAGAAVDLANERGGNDNITLALLRVS